jgi:hypothetical protein
VTATRALTAPVTIAAIAVLVVNDHVLKAAYPGWVTGKLSDVAGLAFFPLLLAAVAERIGSRGVRVTVIAAAATGVVFAAVKTVPLAADAYRVGLAALQWPARAIGALVGGRATPGLGEVQLVMDPTDLLALPALAIPLALIIPRGFPRAEVARGPHPALDHSPSVTWGSASDRSTPRTDRRTSRTA